MRYFMGARTPGHCSFHVISFVINGLLYHPPSPAAASRCVSGADNGDTKANNCTRLDPDDCGLNRGVRPFGRARAPSTSACEVLQDLGDTRRGAAPKVTTSFRPGEERATLKLLIGSWVGLAGLLIPVSVEMQNFALVLELGRKKRRTRAEVERPKKIEKFLNLNGRDSPTKSHQENHQRRRSFLPGQPSTHNNDAGDL